MFYCVGFVYCVCWNLLEDLVWRWFYFSSRATSDRSLSARRFRNMLKFFLCVWWWMCLMGLLEIVLNLLLFCLFEFMFFGLWCCCFRSRRRLFYRRCRVFVVLFILLFLCIFLCIVLCLYWYLFWLLWCIYCYWINVCIWLFLDEFVSVSRDRAFSRVRSVFVLILFLLLFMVCLLLVWVYCVMECFWLCVWFFVVLLCGKCRVWWCGDVDWVVIVGGEWWWVVMMWVVWWGVVCYVWCVVFCLSVWCVWVCMVSGLGMCRVVWRARRSRLLYYWTFAFAFEFCFYLMLN